MERLLEYNRKDLRNWAGEELAAQFFDNRSKYPAPYNNLDYWISKSTPQELETYMKNYVSKNQKRKEEMAGAEKVYDDGRWLVVHCKTYDAMKYYGKGTKWCIAGNYPGHETRGQEYFNSYTQSRYLGYYVFIDRKGKEGYDKWCVCPYQDDPLRCDIWDAPDHTVDCIMDAPTVKGLPDVSNMIIEGDTLVKVKKADDVFAVPENIKRIGRKAMAELYSHQVYLPDGLEAIGSGAFAKSYFKDMEIPDSVTEVGTALFLMCENLNEVELGRGVSSLTKNMLAFCDNINLGVYIFGVIKDIDDSWLDGTDTKVYLHKAGNRKLIDWLRNHHIDGIDIDTGVVLTDHN